MDYSNIITTYLGSGLLAARPGAPYVPGCSIWWDYSTGIPYFYGNGAWGTITVTSAQISDSTATGRSFLTASNAASATAILNAVTGDSGSGGVKGMVPAPAAGDAAAKKVLLASGLWVSQSVTSTQITDATTVGNAVLVATDAPTARAAIGASKLPPETSYSVDHVVLAADAGNLLYMDATASNRNFVIPRTLGSTSVPHVIYLARDPSDTTGNLIIIYDCVSAVDTAPVNVIDVLDEPNNLGKVQSKCIRVNGTRVVSL